MKSKRRILVLMLAVVMMFSATAMTAYAATTTEITGTYKTIYTKITKPSKTYYVNVRVYNISDQHNTDIRMIDRDGNIVWEEEDAIPYSSSRQFVCGTNIWKIQARVGGNSVWGDLDPKKAATCNAWE